MAGKIFKNGKEEDWGWNFDGSKYVPIMTDIKPALEEVLKIVRCNCKSSFDNVNVSYQIDEEDLDD